MFPLTEEQPSTMIYIWALLLVVVNVIWLALNLLMLPGNWLMVATAVAVAWWQREAGMISPAALIAIVALAGIGEVIEFVSSAAGVRKAGGTRWAALGSLLGAVVGLAVGTLAIPIPIAGSLLGACGGACIGAWLLEVAAGQHVRRAIKPSLAAGTGRLLGVAVKLAIGVVIWLVIAVAAFWP